MERERENVCVEEGNIKRVRDKKATKKQILRSKTYSMLNIGEVEGARQIKRGNLG
jgi:hypothetical protein